jgi:hypothetical protein
LHEIQINSLIIIINQLNTFGISVINQLNTFGIAGNASLIMMIFLRRYPDDAERVHVVLSREGGLISLGLASQETVTQVSPEPRSSRPVDWGTQ